MRITVGRTLRGQPLRIHLGSRALVIVVGDPGSGRTTLARHLARAWLADLRHTVSLDVDRPLEYLDLAGRSQDTARARTSSPDGTKASPADQDAACLLLLDRDDMRGAESLLDPTPGPVVLTAGSHLAHDLQQAASYTRADASLLALVPASASAPGSPPRGHPRSARGDALQGRLDIPAAYQPVVLLDPAGADRPCHRWQMVGAR
jgi:hypothetical protein